MSETQTIQPEILTDQRMGELVAAVGNHEAKALLLLGMRPEQHYSRGELHSLLADMPGAAGVYIGNPGNQFDYCAESFAPIGIIARDRTTSQIEFGLTEDGDLHGKALASTLLEFSAEQGVRLNSVFGSSQSRTRQRSPYSRIHMMEEALTAPGPVSSATIAESLQLDPVQVWVHLSKLNSAGLITCQRWDRGKDKVSYALTRPYEVTTGNGGKPTELTLTAMEFLSRQESVTLDELTDHCIETLHINPEKISRSRIAQKLAISMNGMDKRGHVERQGYTTKIDSKNPTCVVELTPEQRQLWSDLINRLEEVRTGDLETLNEIKMRGEALLQNPSLVRTLLEKGYAHLDKGDGTGRDMGQLVMRVVSATSTGVTAREIHEQLNTKELSISLWGVRQTLGSLATQGMLTEKPGKVKVFKVTKQ